jgi:galactokinase
MLTLNSEKQLTIPILLKDLYSDNLEIVSYQTKRFEKLLKRFNEVFGSQPVRYFSTPGRTEISGNHTDHNHGMVIAASINLDSIACVTEADLVVEIFSEGYENPFTVNLDNLNPIDAETGTTNALIRGIAFRFIEKGFNVGGFNACITSDVLQGSGLSSSASIEVLIGTIFNHLYNDGKISQEEIAKIGQYAENGYFKKPCGLMDQMACAIGGIISIDFYNPENPVINKIDFEFATQDYSLVIVHTGGSHINLTDDYASIPKEMKKVAAELGKQNCGEVDYKNFMNNIKYLRNKISDRAILRGYHFFKENERVKNQMEALRIKEFNKFLSMVNESGNSSFKYLQNIYSSNDFNYQPVSIALAFTEDFINRVGQGACRVHGGGFEGTIQVYLKNSFVDEFIKYISGISETFKVLNLSIRQTGTTEVIID